jgi:hypothetical protein
MNTLLKRLRRNAHHSERAPIRTASYPRPTTRGHRPLDPELHIVPPFALLSSGPR